MVVVRCCRGYSSYVVAGSCLFVRSFVFLQVFCCAAVVVIVVVLVAVVAAAAVEFFDLGTGNLKTRPVTQRALRTSFGSRQVSRYSTF